MSRLTDTQFGSGTMYSGMPQAERIKNTPVRSCGITDDCKHVLAVYGAGFIWRYEYIAPPPEPVQIEETADEAKEAAEEGADA